MPVDQFAPALSGCDVVFHTAAFFRDSYKGGSHWKQLKRINADGTAARLEAAYGSGIRGFVQTSSIAVLEMAPVESAVLHDREMIIETLENAKNYSTIFQIVDEVIYLAGAATTIPWPALSAASATKLASKRS